MSRKANAAVLLLMAMLVTLLVPASAGAVLVPGQDDDPAAPGAVEALGGCLVAQKAGDILLLLDQSASLQETDPQSARATSAIYLADQLALFAERNDVALGLSVAGFDVYFETRSGWEDVSGGSAAGTVRALEQMRDQNQGFETDYWVAMEGARRELRDRAADQGEAGRCQAVVWFTDGRFELDSRTTSSERDAYGTTKPYAPGIELTSDADARDAERLGRESLCRQGGLADQLRESDVRILGVGLQGGSSEAEDFAFMRAISEGKTGPGDECGAIQGPEVGDFTLASDINDLLFAFDSLGTPDQPPLSEEKPVCTASGCEEGSHSVVLDSSIGSVRVLAGSELPEARIELRGPGSPEPVVLSPAEDGSARLGEVDLNWEWISTTAAEIVVEPDSPDSEDWAGVWSITFVDPNASPEAVARTNIHVDGDLLPGLAAPDEVDWRVGGAVEDVVFAVVRRGSGEVVAPDEIVSSVSMTSSLALPDGGRTAALDADGAEQISVPITIDLSEVSPGQGYLDMQLEVTTAPAKGPNGDIFPGTKLAPQSLRLPVTLLPPLNYPTVAARVDFGTTEGTGPLTADLEVTGPGCIWLEGHSVSASPDGVDDVRVSTPTAQSAQTCLTVEDGAFASLPLELVTGSVGNGAVNGALSIGTAPADSAADAISTEVPFLADMRKPVNEGVKNSTAIGLGILGTLGPLALLWFMAWWQSRIPDSGLLVGVLPISVVGNQVVRTDLARGLDVREHDLATYTIERGGTRELVLPGNVTLKATARNPLDPHVRVTVPNAQVATSASTALGAGRSRLPLAVHQSWVFYREGGGQDRLLFLVAALADQSKRDELVEDAISRVPEIVSGMAGPQSAASVGTQAGDSWDDSGAEGYGAPQKGSGQDDEW